MSRAALYRVVIPASAIALGSLAVLGLLIRWEGASRAYSVGLHTLFRDHLPAVMLVLVASALLAGLLGRALASPTELALTIGAVAAADVIAALFITLAIDEMRRFPDLPRALLTETAGGMQLVSITVGAMADYILGRRAGAPSDRRAA